MSGVWCAEIWNCIIVSYLEKILGCGDYTTGRPNRRTQNPGNHRPQFQAEFHVPEEEAGVPRLGLVQRNGHRFGHHIVRLQDPGTDGTYPEGTPWITKRGPVFRRDLRCRLVRRLNLRTLNSTAQQVINKVRGVILLIDQCTCRAFTINTELSAK